MKSIIWKFIVLCCVLLKLCSCSGSPWLFENIKAIRYNRQPVWWTVSTLIGALTIFSQPTNAAVTDEIVQPGDASVGIDGTTGDFVTIDSPSYEAVLVKNDDYCDDIKTGSDEDRTSACSFYLNYNPKLIKSKLASKPHKVSFICRENLVRNMSIPTSRINDGVCDCCDGEDEINSPFLIECPNTCELSLQDLRKDALTMHRNIQAGLRIKNEIVHRFKQTKSREQKSYETLLQERKAMSTLFVNMQYLLVHHEEPRESTLHWSLLHDRVYGCAMGNEDMCQNPFSSTYFHDKELEDEGIPGIYLNPKKRFVYEYSNAEKEYLLRLKGIERIEQTICFVKDLLPDEDSRIFTRVHEYMSFMDSPGGKLARESTMKAQIGASQMTSRSGAGGGGGSASKGSSSMHSMKNSNIKFKRSNTLFGKYLENGDKGYRRLQVVTLEIVGLLLSPIILPIQGLWYGVQYSRKKVWSDLHELARLYDHSMPIDSTGVGVGDGVGDGFDVDTMGKTLFSTNRRQSMKKNKEKERGSESENEKVHTLPPWKETILRSLSTIAYHIISIDIPGTMIYDIWHNQLDFTRFSVISRIQDSIMNHPFLATPAFIYQIVTRSPWLYIQYYLFSAYKTLPPRRHACLLRQGLITARHEMNQLDERIRQEDEMKALLQRDNMENLAKKRSGDEDSSGSSSSSLAARRRAKKRQSESEDTGSSSGGGLMSSLFSSSGTSSSTTTSGSWMIDYGVDSSWEALHRQCIWRVLPDWGDEPTDGAGGESVDVEHHKKKERYNYTFCLFDEIRQGESTSLGSFHQWGTTLLPGEGGSKGDKGVTGAGGSKKGEKDMKRLMKYLQKVQYQKEKAQLEAELERTSRGSIGVTGGVNRMNRLLNGIVLDLKGLMNSFEDLPETMTSYLSQTVFPSMSWVEEQRVFLQNMDHPLVSYLSDMLQLVAGGDDDEDEGVVNNGGEGGGQKGSVVKTMPAGFDGKGRENVLKEQLQRYYSSQLYDSGTLCAVRPGFKRRTTVLFDCGSEFKITDVLETQTCEYEMRVSCPLACTSYLEEKSIQQLDELGVFGFSKHPHEFGVSSRKDKR